MLDSKAKADKIVLIADDIKAEHIETLDVKSKTPMADFFIVCTGTSTTHINSIGERIVEKMKEIGIRPSRVETGSGSGWVLVDYGDVICHVMSEEKRQFYDLESLWNTLQNDPNLL